ncbi:MAG: YbjN domain-containing protein [Leptolyngbyaceae cyanobacterium]
MSDFNISDATAHPLARYRNHLEFLGYRVEEGETDLVGRHTRKPNLMVRPISDRGVLVSTIYSFTTGLNRLEILEYVNDLNGSLVFMKAYVDDELDLVMETFFEGEYDRNNFSILLDNVEYDMRIFFNIDLTRQYFG